MFPVTPEKSYPAQVAGYWSYVCRWVLQPNDVILKRHAKAIKDGALPAGCPVPVATPEFQKIILENQAAQKMLKEHRKKYTAHMQQAPGATTTTTPVPLPPPIAIATFS